MDKKTFYTLELDKILAQVARYAAFSASRELLERLEPTGKLREAQQRQQETGEARALIEEKQSISIGGARDVRPHARNAERGITLNTGQFLEIRETLLSSERLKKTISKAAERFPLLNEIAFSLYEGKALVAAINNTIDDHGQVLDSASPKLSTIRRDLRITQDRLQSKLQSIIHDSRYATHLQEAIITMRSGRYVIPVKADHKGNVKGIVHDQSSSGATVFVEPTATVELNNKIRELEVAEQDEIHRILTELTYTIGDEVEQIVWTVEALAQLDAAFAKARYASVIGATAPALVDFDPQQTPGSTIRLYQARHPLIAADQVVPIDVELNSETYLLIITGPNTGGKTVSLKTTGLMVLMAQCGLHIPAAEGSTLTVFDNVLADIGEEQSIEQSLSTFSAHLTHIIKLLEMADERALMLLDELGSGTDPAEGAALARAILNDLLMRGITTFVATHYPELKLYAHSTPGVRNASVEFDLHTLSPTYRLIIGLPGRSNALAIATRLGLPDYLIEEARGYIGENDLAADDLLDEIHQTRDEIRRTQARLNKAEAETLRLQEELHERLTGIEEEREALLHEVRIDAEEELILLREEIADLRRRLKILSPTQKAQTDISLDDVGALAEDADALNELVSTPRKKKARPRHPPGRVVVEEEMPKRELRVGDPVFVSTLNAEGEIVAIHGGGEVEVAVGSMRMRVGVDSLERRSKPRVDRDPNYHSGVRAPRPESPGLELNLIGYVIEDAMPALEAYLDQAYLSGLPWVRVVHGKGAGVLRKAVRDALRAHPLVKEYQRAEEKEGGDGATIVRFASRN